MSISKNCQFSKFQNNKCIILHILKIDNGNFFLLIRKVFKISKVRASFQIIKKIRILNQISHLTDNNLFKKLQIISEK